MAILRGVRNYPIYRDKFGDSNLVDLSSSVHSFISKIRNSLPLKDRRSNHSLVEEIFMQTSQIRAKIPQLTVCVINKVTHFFFLGILKKNKGWKKRNLIPSYQAK